MVYRVMSIVPEDFAKGISIVFVELDEQAGKWNFEIKVQKNVTYDNSWRSLLENADSIPVHEFLSIHHRFGSYLGNLINQFIEENALQYQVALVASPGFTHQVISDFPLGSGAQVAAQTRLPVVSDFFAIDVALQGTSHQQDQLDKIFEQPAPPEVIYALMAVLRWRQAANVFASESKASRNSIGGALWIGEEG